jgi:lactam utilization protein B
LQGGLQRLRAHDLLGICMTTTINLNADLGEGFGAYTVIPHPVHTLCVHGDEPTGLATATAARKALAEAGVNVVPLSEMMFE